MKFCLFLECLDTAALVEEVHEHGLVEDVVHALSGVGSAVDTSSPSNSREGEALWAGRKAPSTPKVHDGVVYRTERTHHDGLERVDHDTNSCHQDSQESDRKKDPHFGVWDGVVLVPLVHQNHQH